MRKDCVTIMPYVRVTHIHESSNVSIIFSLLHLYFLLTSTFAQYQPRGNIYICYAPAGRSVLGETVPEVLSTARGPRPRAVLRPRAQFLPIRTDLGR